MPPMREYCRSAFGLDMQISRIRLSDKTSRLHQVTYSASAEEPSITLKKARFVLMLIWVVGSIPAVSLVMLQTFSQGYGTGDGTDKGLLWILPAVLPQIASVFGLSIIERPSRAASAIVSGTVFWALVVISLFYLAVIYAAIFFGIIIYRNDNWDQIFRLSGWVFIVLQFVFFSTYAALFTERA